MPEDRLSAPLELVLTVGLPYSGKSTYARAQGLPIVNPDSIRLALHGQRYAAPAEPFVWAIAQVMVEALFLAGHSRVIVDATHVTAKRREFWLDRYPDLRLVVLRTSPAECIRRAKVASDDEIVPVIERMAKEWDLGGAWE